MDKPEERGTRLEQKLNCFIPADHEIRPMRNQIFAEPLPWTPSSIIHVVTDKKPMRAKIVAIGPGTWIKQYFSKKTGIWAPPWAPPARPDRIKSRDSKTFKKCDAKVGDVIDLGGLEIGGYLFPRITWGNKEVLICTEDDVVGIE